MVDEEGIDVSAVMGRAAGAGKRKAAAAGGDDADADGQAGASGGGADAAGDEAKPKVGWLDLGGMQRQYSIVQYSTVQLVLVLSALVSITAAFFAMQHLACTRQVP